MYLFSYIHHLGIIHGSHTHIWYRIFPFVFSNYRWGLPWRLNSKESTCQGRRSKRHRFDPWIWKTPGGGHGNSIQYSCLENPMDRGSWRATVKRITKSWIWLQWLSTYICICVCVCVFVSVHYIFFIHSSVNEHLCCFHVLATVNSDVMNIGGHVCFQIIVLSGYMPRSEISESYDNSILVFEESLYCFHYDSTNLHSHQQCKRVPFSPHLLQHLLFIDF